MDRPDFPPEQRLQVIDRALQILSSKEVSWNGNVYAQDCYDHERRNPSDQDVVKVGLEALLLRAANQVGINHKIVIELNDNFAKAGIGSIRLVNASSLSQDDIVKALKRVQRAQ